ncbi:MAG TPA: hypothetical protein VG102_00060 [Candidatus Paceibacterota bacterium]|jgi:hypothetical protein|nr:hypothetical protein [Candidatus Paceibacterota bacterium]
MKLIGGVLIALAVSVGAAESAEAQARWNAVATSQVPLAYAIATGRANRDEAGRYAAERCAQYARGVPCSVTFTQEPLAVGSCKNAGILTAYEVEEGPDAIERAQEFALNNCRDTELIEITASKR